MLILNDRIIEQGHFPDGTLLIKEAVARGYDFERNATITWKYENDAETVALMYLTRHLKEHGVERVHLNMPYIPNARQDRVKTNEDIFTLKYFSELINSLGFASVTVLDPHSSVSEALIDRIVVRTPAEYIARAENYIGKENLMLFFPDEGAMKRYSTMSDKPFAFGIKKRDWTTGRIIGLDVSGSVERIEGSRVLIVDDICSKGGTFVHSATKLRELGAQQVFLYVSHCENTIFDGELLKGDLVDMIFTTDSIFTKTHERIKVFNYE